MAADRKVIRQEGHYMAATYDTPRIAQRSNGTINVQNNRTSNNATKQDPRPALSH
jgi:hypothetical protein